MIKTIPGLLVPLALGLTGCPVERTHALCDEPVRTGLLPDDIAESSGVLVSRRHTGVLWTHNDAGHGPDLFAIDSTGALLGRVRVTGAANVDWEDISYGPCPEGGDEECLYIGDIGDNRERREHVVVYVVPEPEPGAGSVQVVRSLLMRYPDEPRDAEALFVMPDGRLFVVTKGRNHPPAIFRWAADPQRMVTDEVATLEHVQDIVGTAVWIPDQVTGATTTPDGRWALVRSYTWLQFFRPLDDGRFEPVGDRVDLTPAVEPQGEAVDIRRDGTVFMTSEEGPLQRRGTVTRMRCRFPG